MEKEMRDNDRYKPITPNNGFPKEQRTWWCGECQKPMEHEIRYSRLVKDYVWFCTGCKGSFVEKDFRGDILSAKDIFNEEDGIRMFWKQVLETAEVRDPDRLPKRLDRGEEFPESPIREGYSQWQEETETSVRFHRWHRMDDGTMCHNWKLWFKKPNWAIRIHWHRWLFLFWPVNINFQRKETNFFELDDRELPVPKLVY